MVGFSIQRRVNSNWKPLWPAMKCAGRCSVKPKVARAVSRAIQLGSLARSGRSAMRTAPASGTSRIRVRMDWSTLAIGDVILSTPRLVEIGYGEFASLVDGMAVKERQAPGMWRTGEQNE